MTATDWIVVGAGGLVGWGLVSWLITVIRQQKAPPVEMHQGTPPPASGRALLSVAELGNSWHAILGVAADASWAEIDTAYHERLAECERTQLSSTGTASDKQRADFRRAQVNEAFEFIRPLKKSL
ncbi:MAG: hypothetical protein E6K43_03880 [Gammaproteobacteria bacterium]|nr:MAG: hypothetical protein E6K43_03880 [Gammaproteobacteria bacterium]